MHKTIAAILCLSTLPLACDVETEVESPAPADEATAEQSQLERAARLAMASMLECEAITPGRCEREGAALTSAVQQLRGAAPDMAKHELLELLDPRDLDDEIADLTSTPDAQQGIYWSGPYDRDDPYGTGDWEPIWLEPTACPNPEQVTGVLCLTTSWGAYTHTGENVSCSLSGVWCDKAAQPDGWCDHDYMVLYLCATPPSGCFESDAQGNPQASGPHDAWREYRPGGGYDFWLCDPALGCSDHHQWGCPYGGFHP